MLLVRWVGTGWGAARGRGARWRSILSMAVGFRALTFFTLAVYLGALLLLRRERAKAPRAA
jgi:hypothetical protein